MELFLQTYLLIPLAYFGLAILVLVFSKLLNDWTTPYSVDEELHEKDNPALALSFSGYILGVVIVFTGALLGPSQGLFMDIVMTGAYSLVGVILLNIARVVNDKLVLYKFSNVKEIIEDQNAGTGAVQFGAYIASALIIAGAINGQGGGPLTALTFFALGQVFMALFAPIFCKFTPFDVHAEIEDDNIAAGAAFGGALIAIGMILMHASAGDFESWQYNLGIFAGEAVIGLALLPLARFGFDKIAFPNADLQQEIKEDRNLGAGIMEACCLIGFAALLSVTFG